MIAVSWVYSGRHAEAQPISRRAIAILEQVCQQAPADTEAKRLLERVKQQFPEVKTTDALLREMLRMRGSGK